MEIRGISERSYQRVLFKTRQYLLKNFGIIVSPTRQNLFIRLKSNENPKTEIRKQNLIRTEIRRKIIRKQIRKSLV